MQPTAHQARRHGLAPIASPEYGLVLGWIFDSSFRRQKSVAGWLPWVWTMAKRRVSLRDGRSMTSVLFRSSRGPGRRCWCEREPVPRGATEQ